MNYKNVFFLFLVAVMLMGCQSNKKFQEFDNGFLIDLPESSLKLEFYSNKIVRVTNAPFGQFSKRESLSVIKTPEKVEWKINSNEKELSISTSEIIVQVDLNTGNCFFKDAQLGNTILLALDSKLIPDTVMGENVFNATQKFNLSQEEGIYGLGQHQDGIMNWRGHEVTLIQTNVHAVNPFLISTKNYGILWDNASKTIFNDDVSGASFWSEVADQVDYYFIAGNNMDDVIAGYRDLTGQAPMFGKWAFGYWQSKERYKDADDLMSIVKEYRERKIPIDNIVQDWCYWADYDPDDADATWKSAKANWSSMKYHPSTYENPEATLKEIHEKYHMHYMISIWPALGPGTEIYKEMELNKFLYPAEHWSSGYLYDAYSDSARDIYWKYIREGLMSKGVDALWMDGTEPELGDQHTFEVSEANIKKFGQTALGSMARNLNAFSLMTTKGAYENWRKDFPDKRVFILTRSAFTGQQRNGAVTWSGDINATWRVFRNQISSGLNFCMAGIPYWTTDIGAFFLYGHDKGYGEGEYKSHEEPSYRELYVRWFQYGAFSPIFRSHGTHTPREVWRFGEPGDITYESLLKFDNLRYRLMPYIYSIAWKVTNESYTMMRGLPMDFPDDPDVFNIDNQFMFGPSMLVTPVTEEQHFPKSGISTRDVKGFETYLPAGNEWYDFWTGQKLEGNQKHWRPTPIDIMPLYVKAGSIIPMGPFKQYAAEIPEDPIELRIYPGADGNFVLFEDENDNYNYENGIFATIEFLWDEDEKTLKIGERKGVFPGMLKERTFNIILVGENHGVGAEITIQTDKEISYSGQEMVVNF